MEYLIVLERILTILANLFLNILIHEFRLLDVQFEGQLVTQLTYNFDSCRPKDYRNIVKVQLHFWSKTITFPHVVAELSDTFHTLHHDRAFEMV